jgi:hypothetical protein
MCNTQTMNQGGSQLRRPPRPGGGPVASLKPERVQEWLKARPDWRLTLRGKGLTRARELSTVSAAAFYGALIAHLAAAVELPVKVVLCGCWVEVTLTAGRHHDGLYPLTKTVLDLAGQIG